MEINVTGEKKAGISAAAAKTVAAKALASLSRKRSSLSLVFVDGRKMAHLNAAYRGKKGPTDILSFASGDREDLGDIFISPVSARKKAAARKMPYGNYLKLLIVHGTLHLCGFDHVRRGDAAKMEVKERSIMRKFNVELK